MSALRHPRHTAYVDDGDRLLVAHLDAAELVSLTDSARLIWRAADGRDDDEVVRVVAEQSGMPQAAIREDVTTFVRTLVTAGLLERRE